MSKYKEDLIINLSDDGMTNDLWQLAYDDAMKIDKLDINNDKERNLLFYLEHFIDDVCHLSGFPKVSQKEDIIQKVFDILKTKDKISLDDICKTIQEVLSEFFPKKKVAYPNTMGVSQFNMLPERDIEKWTKALGDIYSLMREGKDKEIAIQHVLEGWDDMEKLDFENWAKYYERRDNEKYPMKKSAAPVEIPSLQTQKEEIKPEEIKLEDTVKVQKTKDVKRALVSRLNSAEKLLYEFSNVWPRKTLLEFLKGLAWLKEMIYSLETTSSMEDCIIRTANLWDRKGFPEGADFLRKVAQPPEEDIAKQVEKALIGKEPTPEVTTEPLPIESLPTDIQPPETLAEPTAPTPEAPQETMELLPPPVEDLPPPEAPPIEEPAEKSLNKENPFAGSTVKDVLNILEPIAKNIKEREIFRDLSKVDMIMDSLDIASHFPEMSEIISHLLEANNYISTRLDKMIIKLQGGVKDRKEEKPAPQIEMTELNKPIEKEMFEVKEE
jgi:hypothetical protein